MKTKTIAIMFFMSLLFTACGDKNSENYENENEVAITKSIYYDANGKVYEGIDPGGRYRMTVFSYNDMGKVLKKEISDMVDGKWEPAVKDEFVYDTPNRSFTETVSYLLQTGYSSEKEWRTDFKYEFNTDGKGFPVSALYYEYSHKTDKLELTQKLEILDYWVEYASITGAIYYDKKGDEWVKSTREIQKYEGLVLMGWTEDKWNGSEWVPYKKYEIEPESINGQHIYLYYEYRDGEWVFISKV